MDNQILRKIVSSPFLVVLIPIAVSIITVYTIAARSGYNVHPDEYAHLDAFCFFETHWWPPDVNTEGIMYSGYGWSRLYDGELVYFIYGKLARLQEVAESRITSILGNSSGTMENSHYLLFTPAVLRQPDCTTMIWAFPKYRPFNVWLYLFTLLVLASLVRKHPWPFLIALVLLSLPQVSYVYSYANSDAWGLSMSVFLFSFMVLRRKSLWSSWPDLVALSVLTALVLLSKKTFWVAIPYAYLLLGLEALEEWKTRRAEILKITLVRLPVLALLTLIWVAPLKIIYPSSQGNFAEQTRAMREARAIPGYKPSQPTQIGFHLAERGFPVWSAANMLWFKQSAASFYGLFGYMSERLPQWLYALVFGLMSVLIASTYLILFIRWKGLPFIERSMVLIAPFYILLVILVSLYNSWTFDFQPQGRYLFAALIPLALMEGGLFCYETRRTRVFRLVTWLVLYLTGLAVLWIYVIGNPEIIPG